MASARLPRSPFVERDLDHERLWRKQRLALAFRIFGRFGFDEGVAGHITARDPEHGDRFWVNPFGMSFKQITVDDLLLVDHDGRVVEGSWPVNRAAFAIHSSIHQARPDVVAAAHSHSKFGRAFAALGRTLEPLTQDSCIFHGDHALGLAGIVQRLSLDRVKEPVEIYFPKSGQAYYERLIRSTIYHRAVELVPCPVAGEGGVVGEDETFVIEAFPLVHSVDTYGYRIKERDGVRFDKAKLASLGLRGPQVGALQREGRIEVDGEVVTLDSVTETKRGAAFGFVMDTRPCDGARALVRGTDLAVVESTYLERDRKLARDHKHLTATEAATIAQEGGCLGTLVLTHFSQRYPSTKPFVKEAEAVFPSVVAVRDLDRVPLPRP